MNPTVWGVYAALLAVGWVATLLWCVWMAVGDVLDRRRARKERRYLNQDW